VAGRIGFDCAAQMELEAMYAPPGVGRVVAVSGKRVIRNARPIEIVGTLEGSPRGALVRRFQGRWKEIGARIKSVGCTHGYSCCSPSGSVGGSYAERIKEGFKAQIPEGSYRRG
jgi:hypothetical protein